MTKPVTEQELAEKAVAPRVTKADIDALMARVTYTVEQRPGGTTSTFVHAFLDGKFFLATGFSACVNAENFNADIGERMARGNAEKHAENKLWELEGYRLFADQFYKNEKYCSDERSCVNCFADQYSTETQGECLDAPKSENSEETQAVQGTGINSYADHYSLIEKGNFLLKVLEAPASKDIISLAETKLQAILNKF
ncbi:phage family protein [Acinetobacter baumannii 573719]|nr:phage family protein [Acinetobacter baumannii 573719]